MKHNLVKWWCTKKQFNENLLYSTKCSSE